MSLRRSGFRWLWAGSTAGNLADGVAFATIPLVATSLTTDPTLIAGLDFVYAVARMLVVVPVGVVVDRMDRRLLLWATNLTRAVFLLVLAAALASGNGSLVLLYVVFAGVGVLETVADNAAISLVPSVVAADDFDRANGRIAATQLVADEFAGPPLGGFLFAVMVALPVAASGSFYAAAGLLFFLLPRRARRRSVGTAMTRPRFWRQAREGAEWIRLTRLLRGLAIISGLASVAYMLAFSILVLYARQTLGLSPTGYGIMLSISALGGVLGTVIAAPARQAAGYRWVVPASLVLGSATMLGLAFAHNGWLAAGLLAAYILHATVWNICSTSLRQRMVPETMRGRTNSFFKLSGLVGLALGSGIAGPIATRFGLSVPFGIAGFIFAAVTGYSIWLFRPENDSDDTTPISDR